MSKLKHGMAAVGAIAAFVGVASLSLPQALAGDRDEGVLGGEPKPFGEQSFDQQSWSAQRAKYEYGLLKQECDTLHYSQPQAYESCLEKARSTRDNLLTQAQGSQQTGQGAQGSAPSQSGQEKGPIEKVTSVVKEKLVDWGLASPGQGQTGAGQQGQGSQQPSGQGRNPLQASFESGQGMQGQAGQQGTQGQQFQGQQGPSGQLQGQQGQSAPGSFQGGNYGQQPQGQSPSQQFQSGGTQGQGAAEVRDYPPQTPQGVTSTGPGFASIPTPVEGEHMDSVQYYQEVARRQYATLKQECDALKRDPTVWEQCQNYAKSIRDKIAGMAEQGG
jgi:hypothetical protein